MEATQALLESKRIAEQFYLEPLTDEEIKLLKLRERRDEIERLGDMDIEEIRRMTVSKSKNIK
jgi:hypothetical protein